MTFCWLARSLFLVSLLTVTSAVRAQLPDADARQVEVEFERGVAAADTGDWPAAERAFARVCERAPTANALLNLATARYHQRKPVSALQALDALEALSSASAAERATAARMRERMAGMLARLAVYVDPPSASVALDGLELAPEERRKLPLDPGSHRLDASASGYTAQSLSIEMEPGERRSVHLVLVEAPVERVAAVPRPPQEDVSASLVASSASAARADSSSKSRRRWLWSLGAVVLAGAAVAVAVPLASREQGCSSAAVSLGGCAP